MALNNVINSSFKGSCSSLRMNKEPHRAAVALRQRSYSFCNWSNGMKLTLDVEQEDDGRWLAEVLELPGALAYGASADEAMVKAEALALRALAEQLEHGEVSPMPITLSVPAAA